MIDPEILAFVRDRRTARLATADRDGTPSVVPIWYALTEWSGAAALVTPIDEKPKTVSPRQLQRVRNILDRPEVAVVVDDDACDWRDLAYVHLRGRAELVQLGEPGHGDAVTILRRKYAAYSEMALETLPLIRITDLNAHAWQGSETRVPPRPNDLATVIAGRRSVRSFSPQPVPRRLVERAIAAAGWAPSPHGTQPWRFAVVESAGRRLHLADAMSATWSTQLSMDGQDPAEIARRLANSRNRLLTAPILVIPCLYTEDLDTYPDPDRQAAEQVMAIQSFGAAVQNFLLSIHASGLDAGWMCAPLFCPDIVREALGLPEPVIPHALIPVGYAAKDPVRRPRRPLADLILDWQ